MEQPVEFEPVENENGRFRLICTTIYDMDYVATLQRYVDKKKLQYVAYGNEVCPSTGRPHLQAFAYAKEGKSPSAWRKLFKPHHLEICGGTLEQNARYCSKASDYHEIGVKPMGNGKKRTLQEVCERIVEGEQLEEVALDVPHIVASYHNGLKYIERCVVNKRLKMIPKDFAPEVIYVHGDPRSGKTRYVFDQESDVYKVPKGDKFKWKDGYRGQEAVLYDNVNCLNIDNTQFLEEIDRYPMQCPVKGGFVNWRPKRIYITSIFAMEQFANAFDDSRELTGRITTVKYISKSE